MPQFRQQDTWNYKGSGIPEISEYVGESSYEIHQTYIVLHISYA